MKNIKKILLPVILACIAVNTHAHSSGVSGEGSITNYRADKQEMVGFIKQTSENIKYLLDYLHYEEKEMYSDPRKRQLLLNFDSLAEAGIITHSYGEEYVFHIGRFWVHYLPHEVGILIDCENEGRCGVKPIL